MRVALLVSDTWIKIQFYMLSACQLTLMLMLMPSSGITGFPVLSAEIVFSKVIQKVGHKQTKGEPQIVLLNTRLCYKLQVVQLQREDKVHFKNQ